MELDPQLLEVLACPEDKGTLHHLAEEDVLVNPRLRRAYPVRDGIPVLLVDEAVALDGADWTRVQARIDGLTVDADPPTEG